MATREFNVECSECEYYATYFDTVEEAYADADRHETKTGHKGPFVWRRPPASVPHRPGYRSGNSP